MNADLLAMLGGGVPSATTSRQEPEGKSILSFKAGKMTTTLQPNGKYLVKPDQRRGTINLTWTASTGSANNNNGTLKFEWKDRRTRTTVDSLTIFPEDDCTYSKVLTGRENDRVYLLQFGNSSERRFFFWMQEKEDGNDDEEFCIKINTFMADPAEAAKAANGDMVTEESNDNEVSSSDRAESGAGRSGGLDMSGLGGGGLDNAALMQIMQGLGNGTTSSNNAGVVDGRNAGGTSGNQPQGQVDALSNILENLGMPQPSNNSGAAAATSSSSSAPNATPAGSSTAPPAAAAPAVPATTGLTLADLQGAMAGLATTSPPTVSTPQPSGQPPTSSANASKKDGTEEKESEAKDDEEEAKTDRNAGDGEEGKDEDAEMSG